MAYGIKIFGDTGAVQIDENYSNLHLVSTGTAVTTTNIGNQGCTYVDIAFTNCTSPIVALRCTATNRAATVILVGKSGTTWTYRFIAATGDGTAASTTGTSISYYFFDTEVNASSETYGIRVFKANGEIAFDSGLPPLRVIDFATDTWDVMPPSSVDRTYPAGRTYAFIPSQTGNDGYRVGDISQFDAYFFSTAKNITNGVQTRAAVLYFNEVSPGDPPIFPYHVDPVWLIVDVTGY